MAAINVAVLVVVFLASIPDFGAATDSVSCACEDVSIDGLATKTQGKLQTDCEICTGALRITNLYGHQELNHLTILKEIKGTLEISNTFDLGDSLSLHKLKSITNIGTTPAVTIVNNTNLKLTFGSSLRYISSSNSTVTFRIRDNDLATLPTDLYTILYQSSFPRAVFEMDLLLDTSLCQAHFYKTLSVVLGTFTVAALLALAVLGCHGRTELDQS
ncbi:unnamed protein product [Caenorhabditis auriculariae]|uniref:Receptor L-domain domain-containing protein n=1 Tax=Caenorhabditis auriculariae TaxID=2777116 RepID=A0A8S1H6E8_9PELO|nr:unnamed protein product [Caenorhabditis auriculariae]